MLRKDEIMNFAGKGMEIKKIMLNGVSKSQKDKRPTFSLTGGD